MANLGFVGLGLMGSRIVKKFLDAGYSVTGYNRTRDKAQWLIDAGMKWGESPRAVAEQSDITFSMVTDSQALQQIADEIIPELSSGKIYVDMSTVSPRLIRELAARVSEQGAEMLRAPVSGSIPAIEAGTLVPFVGGNAATLERVRPIFQVLAQKICTCGRCGTGDGDESCHQRQSRPHARHIV